jgi:LEA14-like dessication related protein
MRTVLARLAAFAVLASALLLAGCASLNREMARAEKPRISLSSLKILPSDGIEQRIQLGLRVLNPNGFAIAARGLVVDVRFNDIEVLNGVASDLPLLPAYSEIQVPVIVTANLLSMARLMQVLMEHPDDPLHYRLEARLDLKRVLGGRIRILEQGEISARSPSAPPPVGDS